MLIRTCANCDVEYRPRRSADRKICCSGKCWREYRIKHSSKYIAKDCRQCGNEFLPKARDQIFCSHSCSAIFHNLMRYGERPVEQKLSFAERRDLHLRTTSFEELGETHKREVILREQGSGCGECGITEWCNKPISLELEHKDGNNTNWHRSNLVYLCPNCHSQTPTWRGRNRKGSTKPIKTDTTSSLRQLLIARGLTPKGGNYKVLKKELGL